MWGPPPPRRRRGCYVATAVYGSYDCPEVWTLRRYRDEVLANSVPGRLFIKTYYAVSPTFVKLFKNNKAVMGLCRSMLDPMVAKLHKQGFEDTAYDDPDY